MMKRTLACAIAIGLLSAPALAKPVTIKYAFPAPPKSLVNQWGVTPWAKDVEKASGGTLAVKIFAGPVLANFRNVYDRTLKGVTDISFGIHAPIAGQFKKTAVGSLPFETRNTLEGALALWRVYDKGLIADEHARVKVLALFLFPHSVVHTKKTIKTLDDLKGMKLHASSRMMAQAAIKVGITPVTMTPPQIYQAIGRGLIQGTMISWTAVYPFKLDEVTNHHLEVPLGGSTAFMFMNQKSFDRLPAKARQAIDRYSGEAYSRRMGKTTVRMGAAGRARVKAMKGHTVVKAAGAESARWKKLLAPLTSEWVKRTPGGADVLKGFRAEIAKIRSGS